MKTSDVRKLLQTDDARRGYTYFVTGTPSTGYSWNLVAPNNDTMCASETFAKRTDCLRMLRAVQRQAVSTDVVDESDA